MDFSGITSGERHHAALAIIMRSRLSTSVLKFLQENERVVSMQPQIAQGLTIVAAYVPKRRAKYPAFLESGWCPGRNSNELSYSSTGGQQSTLGAMAK